MPDVFKIILTFTKCGFAADKENGKEEKTLYHTKVITARLNSIAGKHRIVQSFDPTKKTTKYLLTNELTWEATKIISAYSHRWVIEEFFRNAKQLSDMEGATIRSEQGVTLALCLVSWIDFLLHFENYKQSTAGKLSKEPLTVPSIVRQAQYDNLEAFVDRVQKDEAILEKWFEVETEVSPKLRPIFSADHPQQYVDKGFSGEFLVFVANGIKIIVQCGLGDDMSQIREGETITPLNFMPSFGHVFESCSIYPDNGCAVGGRPSISN